MVNEGINKKWRIFAEKIAEGSSATEAYLSAGYEPTTRASAQNAASRLRQQPKVAAYLRELRHHADTWAREDTQFTIQRKLELLYRIATTGAGGLSETDELVQYHRTFKDGSTATRLPCKLKAIKMHSELCGHLDFEPVPVELPQNPLTELVHQIRSGQHTRASHSSATESRPKGRSTNPFREDHSTDPMRLDPDVTHLSHDDSATVDGSDLNPTSPSQNPIPTQQNPTEHPDGQHSPRASLPPNPPSEIRNPPSPDPQLPDSYPRIRPKSPKTLELERMRASWTPSPQPCAYPGDLPGVKRKPKCTVIR